MTDRVKTNTFRYHLGSVTADHRTHK